MFKIHLTGLTNHGSELYRINNDNLVLVSNVKGEIVVVESNGLISVYEHENKYKTILINFPGLKTALFIDPYGYGRHACFRQELEVTKLPHEVTNIRKAIPIADIKNDPWFHCLCKTLKNEISKILKHEDNKNLKDDKKLFIETIINNLCRDH